jgi:hypothetical protein
MIFAVAKHHKFFKNDFDIEDALKLIEEKRQFKTKICHDLKQELEKPHINCRSTDKAKLKLYNADRGGEKEKKEDGEKKDETKKEAPKVEPIPVCIKLKKEVFLILIINI